jgi:hypothetical protein
MVLRYVKTDMEIVQKVPNVPKVQDVQSRLWRDAVGVTGIEMWIDPITYRGRDRNRYRFYSVHPRKY